MDPLSTKHDITAAWEKAMMLLYRCLGSTSSLSHLRHLKFIENVAVSASYFESKVLQASPVMLAASTYLEFICKLDHETLRDVISTIPSSLIQNGLYCPIIRELPAGPDSFLAVFHCYCKIDCPNMRCTCKKWH